MLNQILTIIKLNASDLIVNNDAIPNQHNDAIINDIVHSTINELTQAIRIGGLQEILFVFSEDYNLSHITQNPVVRDIINNVVSQVSSKYGIDASQTEKIALSLIPQVLILFCNKILDPNESSINIGGLIDLLTADKNISSLNTTKIEEQFLGKKSSGVLGGFLGKFLG